MTTNSAHQPTKHKGRGLRRECRETVIHPSSSMGVKAGLRRGRARAAATSSNIIHHEIPSYRGLRRAGRKFHTRNPETTAALPNRQQPLVVVEDEEIEEMEAAISDTLGSTNQDPILAGNDRAPSPPRAVSNRGLVEATLLPQESNRRVLQEAHQVDRSQLQQKAHREQKERQCQRIGLGVIVVSLVILAVSLGVGLTTSKDGPTAGSFTEAPSTEPPISALELLLQGLPNGTLNNIFTAGTPQEQAYAWLVHHPNITNLPGWRIKQMFALSTFYYAFEGPIWFGKIKTNWLDEKTNECNWFSGEHGSFCYQEGYEESTFRFLREACNSIGEFWSLDLPCLQLGGLSPSIPPEIAMLTSLSTIDLTRSHINAHMSELLPSELYQLTNLTRLYLYSNSLSGPIPSQLGELMPLGELYVAGNSLTGPIPSELGKLMSLEELDLYDNSLTGPIPSEFGLLTSLTILALHENLLSGPIPSELGMLPLFYLHLHDNSLSGPIPSELAFLTNLLWLRLEGNSLSGPIPSELGMLTHLQHLDLHNNSLSGSIPSELGMLTSLTRLHLSMNSFMGGIGMLPFIIMRNPMTTVSLDLSDFGLTGALPSELGLFCSLTSLRLPTNQITGSIPTELGLLTNITLLDLHENSLSGPIPSELGKLTLLSNLPLHGNSLSGPIPSDLGKLTLLSNLLLHDNSLSDPIPSDLGKLMSLDKLILYGNSLSGPIPRELLLFSSLDELDLGGNSLSGTISSELGKLQPPPLLAHWGSVEVTVQNSFDYLDLGGNSFVGPIPTEVGMLSLLDDLILSRNSLSGQLPSEIGLLTTLSHLSLYANSLTGSIPSELSLLTSLGSIQLENNSLSGTVSDTLCRLHRFNPVVELGLSFDCDEDLCGCCWCNCPVGSESNLTDCHFADAFEAALDDEGWPGLFPTPINSSNVVTINIFTDRAPEETTWEWSTQKEIGSWKVLETGGPLVERKSLYSFTKKVESNDTYKLKILDSYGDGTCCRGLWHVFGWFTITNSTPSQDHENGTVIWDATGDVFEDALDVLLWIDEEGNALHVNTTVL